ncbi:MAG: hypothetical protein ACKOCD_01080 [Nitrospiraceae bacterium]
MWIFRLFIFGLTLTGPTFGSLLNAWAVEEGELVKRDGRWQYVSTDDPSRKYLYLKGIITQEEYDKGRAIVETRERLRAPRPAPERVRSGRRARCRSDRTES